MCWLILPILSARPSRRPAALRPRVIWRQYTVTRLHCFLNTSNWLHSIALMHVISRRIICIASNESHDHPLSASSTGPLSLTIQFQMQIAFHYNNAISFIQAEFRLSQLYSDTLILGLLQINKRNRLHCTPRSSYGSSRRPPSMHPSIIYLLYRRFIPTSTSPSTAHLLCPTSFCNALTAFSFTTTIYEIVHDYALRS